MPCDYCLQAIDTGAGKVPFDAPIQVAKVVADSDVHESGIPVFPSFGETKYQVHCRAIAFGSFFTKPSTPSSECPSSVCYRHASSVFICFYVLDSLRISASYLTLTLTLTSNPNPKIVD